MTVDQQKQIRDLLGNDDIAKGFVNRLNVSLHPEIQEEKSRNIHRYKLNKGDEEYKQIKELNILSRKIFDILKSPKGDLNIRLEKFGFSQGFVEQILNFYGATSTILDQIKIKRGARPRIEEHQITMCARVMMCWEYYYPHQKISLNWQTKFYIVMEIIVGHDPRQLIERTLKERVK